MATSTNNHFPSLAIIFISLFIAITGVSCGGGGGSTPPPPTDQDAQGLYTTNGDGSGTFKDGANPDIVKTLTDVKGMIYGSLPNQKFIFFDIASNVLYDGTITSITLTAFTGTAVVYNDGVMVDSNVAVSGTITSRSSIDMTLAASGNFVGGSIKGLFSSEYDKGATNARILSDTTPGNPEFKGAVIMAIPGMTTGNFEVASDNNYNFSSVKTGPTTSCSHIGSVVLATNVNIYTLSEEITSTFNCTISLTNYTGFASVVDGAGTDTRLWYVVTNGTDSIFAILDK